MRGMGNEFKADRVALKPLDGGRRFRGTGARGVCAKSQ